VGRDTSYECFIRYTLQPSLTLGFPCASLPLRSGYKPFRSGTMITTSARIHALCSGVALVGRVVGTGSATRNLLIGFAPLALRCV